ncbi:hypothetical protein Hypma_005475 [Hypsizygus marmoreus]|uniref:Uncharacterized protein n=1 Tax=Hypsizygus marmoreus TaxID=39966 RepID=A0A369J855_HYPMA|nr:hypothetical protein Hypma_005475 [Hypsizygus marmoreus]
MAQEEGVENRNEKEKKEEERRRGEEERRGEGRTAGKGDDGRWEERRDGRSLFHINKTRDDIFIPRSLVD